MASFVIHHIVGVRVLSLLEEYGVELSEQQKTQFLLGNLIVDSTKLKLEVKEGEDKNLAKERYRKNVQMEKVFTHFRDEGDANLCIQSPVPEKFVTKYEKIFENDLSALGYLLHLYTDKAFFQELFPATFETLDDNLEPTIYLKEATKIRVIKDGKVYDVKEFWNNKGKGSIYEDYTIMNKILLDYFLVEFNKSSFISAIADFHKLVVVEEYYGKLIGNIHKFLIDCFIAEYGNEKFVSIIAKFLNPGIEEVDYANIVEVINKTDKFIKESHEKTDSTLCVFTEENVIKFVDVVAKRFIENNFDYLKVFDAKSTYQRKLTNDRK